MTDYEFIQIISDSQRISEHEKAFSDFYNRYKGPFYGFLRPRFKGRDDNIIYALYDEACLVIKSRSSFNLPEKDAETLSLKSLLFTIGRNKLIDYIRQNNRNTTYIENINYDMDDTDERDYGAQPFSSEDSDENTELVAVIRHAVNAMKEPCNRILTLFYWDNLSGKEIAEVCGYASEDVAKTQKYKCMNKLKAYIKNLLK